MAYVKQVFSWVDEQDSDFGVSGWVPKLSKGCSVMTPGGGATVAHDTLEHFRRDGTIEDELEAAGAFFYGRLENGTDGDGDFSLAIARDLAELRFNSVTRLPKTLRTLPNREVSYLDECAGDIVEKTVEAMKRRQEDSETVIAEGYSREWAEAAIHWVRRGYRLARARWDRPEAWVRGNGSYTAQTVFNELTKSVDALTKQYRDYVFTGLELRVLVSPASGNFSLTFLEEGRVPVWSI